MLFSTGIPVVSYDGPNVFEAPVGQETFLRMIITNKGSRSLNVSRDPVGGGFVTVLNANCAGKPIPPSQSCFVDLSIRVDEPGVHRWPVLIGTDSFVRDINTAVEVTGIVP